MRAHAYKGLACWLWFTITGLCGVSLAQSWIQTSTPTNDWLGVACSADGRKLVAVAYGDGIYTSTNSGATWDRTSAPSNVWHCVVSSADGQKLVAAAGGSSFPFFGAVLGTIFMSTNAGLSWSESSAPINYWNRLACSGDGSRIIAAANGSIYWSSDSGANWVLANAPSYGWTAIAGSADGKKLAVVDFSYRSYLSIDFGANWTETMAPPGVYETGLASSADGSRLIAGSHDPFHPYYGNISISTNAGITWTSTGVSGRGAVASSADGSILLAVEAAGYLYPGALVISTNFGQTWSDTDAPILNWTSLAASADGHRLIAASKDGGIYASQSAPKPLLNIEKAESNCLISWIVPSHYFALQEQSQLSPSAWDYPAASPVLNKSNLRYELILPKTTATHFYRLKD